MKEKRYKVGICTDTGWNYGSALQSYATKEILSSLGCQGEVIKLSGSLVPGRDVRIKKALIMGARMLCYSPEKFFRSVPDPEEKDLTQKTKAEFQKFYDEKIMPVFLSEHKLKTLAHRDEYAAFLCGSDQIWITTAYYVDPFYYLAFAPKEKRIAFAPSFGREFIPEFNRKKISRYLKDIPVLSVREDSGAKLIRELTGKTVPVLADPTLVLDREQWISCLGLQKSYVQEPYVLAYFLSRPSERAQNMMKAMGKRGYKIITLPYQRKGSWFDRAEEAGPKEFLQLLLNASLVCTDSFHGTAFSVNFEKNFYAFQRDYGSEANQSTRLTSLLGKTELMCRFDPDSEQDQNIDFSFSRAVLNEEREKSIEYLRKALKV